LSWLGLACYFLAVVVAASCLAQSPKPAEGRSATARGLQKLAGEDARRAEQLNQGIEKDLEADRWNQAIAKAGELLALRAKVQGPKHFESVNAEWLLQTLRRVASMPREDRAAYRSVGGVNDEAASLDDQGKHALAGRLHEKALEIYRRLLTENHPDTARAYANLASNLDAQGKYAKAHSLFEKALEISRRLLTDEHPDTAFNYMDLAFNLNAQGKYSQAQSLYEKGLEIIRRLLSDDDINTADAYDNVAANLDDLGRHAEAKPLYEKALAIRRRLLTDDHSDTADSYNNLAYNLNHQGKHAEARPLYLKALEIRRRLLTDEHPSTADSYNNVAANLDDLRQHKEAQPYYETALGIRRRLLTDDHPRTAASYNNLAFNLQAQGKYAQSQELYEKALANRRRLLTDDHPDTAAGYNNLALALDGQGKHPQARPLHEKALEIYRRMLGDDHLYTANSYHNLALNLSAQGKYAEARDHWIHAVKSLDAVRLRVAFAGLERAGSVPLMRPNLAAVLARLGQPAEAWQALEEDLGRGLLDELAARQNTRLTSVERDRIRELTAELERLDKVAESNPKDLTQSARAKRFEELKHQRELASIALGEFQTKLLQEHGSLAGRVAGLDEIQAGLPADAALLAWSDIPPAGPNAADPDGEHWGVVVRSRGTPAWVRLPGTGAGRHWSREDTNVPSLVRDGLTQRPGPRAADTRPSLEKLRHQRLGPLADTLGPTSDGLPAARRLVVLPSPALAGIPVEALLEPADPRTISYAPSATVLGLIRGRPRLEGPGGLLALGDPVFEESKPSPDPPTLPDRGLLITVVVAGSNADKHGVKPGEVLLSYDGRALRTGDDLKPLEGPGPEVAVDFWDRGQVRRRRLDGGKLGVVVDPRPAATAIREQRKFDQMLTAARSGSEHLERLPGTRLEVQSLARVFGEAGRPVHLLVDSEASEQSLEQLAASRELGRFAYIHLATHGLIDEAVPFRSAVALTQTGLPDPLGQVLNHKPAFDGRLTVREIQRGCELSAELVTLSACETARGQYVGGEGFVGFAQALLMSGARSVCLSLWKVDDVATALLMRRFYANLLGRGGGPPGPLPKAEALAEAKRWLRELGPAEASELAATLTGGVARSKDAPKRKGAGEVAAGPVPRGSDRPYAHPYYWAAFILVGDPD
jgi:tetratricopeptide (TPR) repeat protein